MSNNSGNTWRRISRRTLLRGAGVSLALPLLDLMAPRAQAAGVPRRMFGICNNLGLLPGDFFPTGAGREYTPSPYLKILQDHREHFTVFSGVSHPNVDGGHPADISFLTAAPHPASSSFRNTISLDQYIAERIGTQTRFPSLTLAVNTGARSLSWTGSGVAIPPEQSAANVFRQMFVQGTPKEVEAKLAELDTGRSILDAVADQTRDLERKVGPADRARLDQYFTSVRDLENRLQASKGWERKPKPVVKESEPRDPASPTQYMAKVAAMYGLVRLAFETDSTRSVTLMLDSVSTPVLEIRGATISDGYHNLSHHGKSEDKLAQLRIIDTWHMRLLADLFKGKMACVLESTPSQQRRHVAGRVGIGIAQIGTIQDHGAVEKRFSSLLNTLEPFEEIRQQTHVPGIDGAELRQLRLRFSMM